jgi:hypothetical protein
MLTFVLAKKPVSVSEKSGSCDALNAVAQVRMDKFFEQYVTDLQPINSPVSIITQSVNLQILQYRNLDLGKLERTPRATRVIRSDMNSRKTLPVIDDALLTSLAKNRTSQQNPNALVWSLSNVFPVEYEILSTVAKGKENGKNSKSNEQVITYLRLSAVGQPGALVHVSAGFTVAALLIPNSANHNYSDINFLFFDAEANTLANMSASFGSIPFVYPFNDTFEEYFDENGNVIGTQPTNIERSAINIEHLANIAHSSQDNTIRIRILSVKTERQADFTTSFEVSFVAIITTQKSTKLIYYIATTNGSSVISFKVVSKLVLIPRVESSDHFDFIANGNLGARMVEHDSLYVTLTMNRRQYKAFNKWHKMTLDFPDGVEDAVFLLKIDLTSGIIGAVNLSSKLGLKTAYATDIDLKESLVLVTGNSDNFALTGNITDKQVPFISIVDITSLDSSSYNLDSAVQNNAGKERFVAFSGVFAVDAYLQNPGNRVTLGGGMVTIDNPNKIDGRLLLFKLTAANQTRTISNNLDHSSLEDSNTPTLRGALTAVNAVNQAYSLRVGYSGSNTVTLLKRILLKVPIDIERYELIENYLLGCIFDAPTTKEPNGKDKSLKLRTVHSGLWQVNCAKENMKVKLGFEIFFFTIFGVNTSILLLVILYNSARCVLDIRNERQKELELAIKGYY